jgi:hypothetical protein
MIRHGNQSLRTAALAVVLTIAAQAGGLQASPSAHAASPKADACALLTRTDIAVVQTESVRETRASEQRGGDLRLLQCFYTTATFTKSVTVMVALTDQGSTSGPADYWKKQFSRTRERENEKNSEGPQTKPAARQEEEEERESGPPVSVSGVGEEAYWVGNNFSSSLYVLAGDKFLRVSIGGNEDRETKLHKSKELAQRALRRLSTLQAKKTGGE